MCINLLGMTLIFFLLNYSRSTMKKGKGHWNTTIKGLSQGISKLEIYNFLLDFKHYIINDVATHLDKMTAKKKQKIRHN